ncbi:hypothetical protein ATM97_31720 [Nocardia sp. MH4]|uniref:hypothetical protein n=1 Tax=Nocardia sp. MH4 TaxID=1768677 RepID=UPI002102F482|nr:hypothetical protein [Nocardia sp. MH4]MBW0273883.1 hypothetical protein [Nocardia sp. MH4]
MSPDVVRSRPARDESLCTIGGALHCGVLMSLADATGAVCAFLDVETEIHDDAGELVGNTTRTQAVL